MKSDWISSAFAILLFFLYGFGLYRIIADDHRYTSKDVMIGVVVFPYPWWVGGKELYRLVAVSSEDREFEEKCLDATEAMGAPRKARLRFCECFVETKSRETCAAKFFSK